MKMKRNLTAVILLTLVAAAPLTAAEINLVHYCIVTSTPEGADWLLVVEKTGVELNLLCDGATTLGRVCAALEAGDCADFMTEFVPPDSDLHGLGFPLVSVEVSRSSPSTGPGGGPGDGDGDPPAASADPCYTPGSGSGSGSGIASNCPHASAVSER